jgi:hypothetical protein
MTRKDYRRIAKVFRDALDNGQIKTREDVELFTSLALAMCETLKEDNSEFRKDTFLDACGAI